jgi:excisionase family DNA binding protein
MDQTAPTAPKTLAEFITVKQLAEHLGVTKQVIAHWRANLGLPSIKLGQSVFFHDSAVAAWLKDHETVARTGEE